jgi:hypothetical protein
MFRYKINSTKVRRTKLKRRNNLMRKKNSLCRGQKVIEGGQIE